MLFSCCDCLAIVRYVHCSLGAVSAFALRVCSSPAHPFGSSRGMDLWLLLIRHMLLSCPRSCKGMGFLSISEFHCQAHAAPLHEDLGICKGLYFDFLSVWHCFVYLGALPVCRFLLFCSWTLFSALSTSK